MTKSLIKENQLESIKEIKVNLHTPFMKCRMSYMNDKRLSEPERLCCLRITNRIEHSQGKYQFYNQKNHKYYAIYTIDELIEDTGYQRAKVVEMIQKLCDLHYFEKHTAKRKPTEFYFLTVQRFVVADPRFFPRVFDIAKKMEKKDTIKATPVGFYTKKDKKPEEENKEQDYKSLYEKTKETLNGMREKLQGIGLNFKDSFLTATEPSEIELLKAQAEANRAKVEADKVDRRAEKRKLERRDCDVIVRHNIDLCGFPEQDAQKIADATLYKANKTRELFGYIYIAKKSVRDSLSMYRDSVEATSFEDNEIFENNIGKVTRDIYRAAMKNVGGRKGKTETNRKAKNVKNYVITSLKRYIENASMKYLRQNSEYFLEDHEKYIEKLNNNGNDMFKIPIINLEEGF